jgi:hypothetical protein
MAEHRFRNRLRLGNPVIPGIVDGLEGPHEAAAVSRKTSAVSILPDCMKFRDRVSWELRTTIMPSLLPSPSSARSHHHLHSPPTY